MSNTPHHVAQRLRSLALRIACVGVALDQGHEGLLLPQCEGLLAAIAHVERLATEELDHATAPGAGEAVLGLLADVLRVPDFAPLELLVADQFAEERRLLDGVGRQVAAGERVDAGSLLGACSELAAALQRRRAGQP